MDTLHELRQRLFRDVASAESATMSVIRARWTSIAERMLARLAELEDRIESAISRGMLPGVAVQVEADRLRAFVAEYGQGLAEFGQSSAPLVESLRATHARLGAEHSASLLNNSAQAAEFSGVLNRLNPLVIESLISQWQLGSPISKHFDNITTDGASQVRTIIEDGIVRGISPRNYKTQIAQALDVPTWRGATIARTESMRAYRGAGSQVILANREYLDGWIWHASLSPRTCAACLAMHGTLHRVDEMLDSHVNCRCSQSPLVTGDDRIFASGEEWLRAQSADVQRAALGKRGAQMFADGRPLVDWVHTQPDPVWGMQRRARTPK